MPSYLLDTNICAYIQRQRPAAVLAKFRGLEAGEAAISTITYGELIYGAEKSERRSQILKNIEEVIGLMAVLPVPKEAGAIYGALRADLERRGEVIGNNDFWIAAHAKAADLILVTNNTREFNRIPGLKIENWAE
jgi:tRNA(fMet)-specific endonuclease VapC